MSSLPGAKYCGLSPRLSERYGAGRAAIMSSAFHAMCAGDRSLLHRLTEEERKEVEGWQKPPDVVLDGGTVLRYAEADKEMEVCLDHMGDSCAPADALTVGHLDFAWMPGEFGHAYVADIKKTRWSASDGPESLQLHAYGMAYAQMRGADSYVTGIWIPTDGEWWWSEEAVVLGSPRHVELWGEIRAAALHTGEKGITGSHCASCYGRLHCPEWTLPGALAVTDLAPLAAGGTVTSSEEAAKLVRLIAAGEQVFEQAKKRLHVLVERGEIEVVDGKKRWAPVACKGKVTVNREKLEAELGDGAKRFLKQGKGYEQWRWVNR